MLKILNNDTEINLFIEVYDILRDHVNFGTRNIYLGHQNIARLNEDGLLVFQNELSWNLIDLEIVLKFLKLCQTYLTTHSDEIRKLQEKGF